ncbi:hypothetical protein MCAP1_000294 [Malassezia caprae]|uniref:GLTSCR protein conserved domain-containing protein n=1 Tax=Malassezia caprae TaxID=1381934 RepID=A0AAF0IUV3_9BASI|nr:hypothetical protein MCAP1_000294 [Malassezia caprae]
MPEANELRAAPAAASVGSLPSREAGAAASAPSPITVPIQAAPARPGDPYTRPVSSVYSHPIVTVNRQASAAPAASQRPGVPPARPPMPPAPATPPFIVSNSLAAASGLYLGGSRAPGGIASAGRPVPPAHSAPAARLPPQKDLVLEDPELAAQRAHIQRRFRAQLDQDHERCLRPDIQTPFRDARDVVERLLPYHVWQVPESDLLGAMDARIVAPPAPRDIDDEAHMSFAVPYVRKRRRVDDPLAPDTPLLALPPFPSEAFTRSAYERRAQLARRFRAIQTRSDTAQERAPHMHESLEFLERMVYEDEMKAFQDLSAELRRARAELEELERQRHWRPGASLAASLHTPGLLTASSALSAAGLRRPGIDDMSRPYAIVRPPSMDGHPAVSAASLPALSPATVSHLAGLAARGASGAPIGGAGGRPDGGALNVSETLSASTSIPSQPLPLVVPMTSVPKLTALGLHLVPAPHLLPALSLASAGQSVALNPGLTAPRPVAGVQTDPVLLVGITDASTPLPPGANAASRQRLHLSVVLSKLRPEQLSGLAQLMQTLQTEDEAARS